MAGKIRLWLFTRRYWALPEDELEKVISYLMCGTPRMSVGGTGGTQHSKTFDKNKYGSDPPPTAAIVCCAVCAGHLTAHVGTTECHCLDIGTVIHRRPWAWPPRTTP